VVSSFFLFDLPTLHPSPIEKPCAKIKNHQIMFVEGAYLSGCQAAHAYTLSTESKGHNHRV